MSSTVQQIARPPSVASSSITRDCCGQSMCDAVVICQKPPGAPSARIAVILCVCVCPFTQATTHGWPSSTSRSSSARMRRSAPGGRVPLTMVSSGWWLNSTTGRSAQAVSSPSSQPSWVASSEPCQPPCGLTVSRLMQRTGPWSNA